jgi:hypothetical protein
VHNRRHAVRGRFLIAGTLLGGVVLSLLSWVTAAILPPRYKQFKDAPVVVANDPLNPPTISKNLASGLAQPRFFEIVGEFKARHFFGTERAGCLTYAADATTASPA